MKLWCFCVVGLVAAFGTAPQANAGCGDYVLVNGMESHEDVGTRGDFPLPRPPYKSRPCQGPHCHNQPLQVPANTVIEIHWIDGMLVRLGADMAAGDALAWSHPCDRVWEGNTSEPLLKPPRI